MVTVSPSLLSCDFLNIESELKSFEGQKDLWLHLDIMDGHFVPNLTFGNPIIRQIAKKTKIPLDAHFMVSNPEFYIDGLQDVPLHNFTFHLEATSHPLTLVKKAKNFYKNVGVSIRPKTPVSALSDDLICDLDLVLVMSVEPGFGGQEFIEGTYDKIRTLRERSTSLNTKLTIQVDGGVNSGNAKKLIDAGADNLVAGSFVFNKGPNKYTEAIGQLRS